MADFDWNTPPTTLRATRTVAGWSVRVSRRIKRTQAAVLVAFMMLVMIFAGVIGGMSSEATQSWNLLMGMTLAGGLAVGLPIAVMAAADARRAFQIELRYDAIIWDGDRIDAAQVRRPSLTQQSAGTEENPLPMWRLEVAGRTAELVASPESARWVRDAIAHVGAIDDTGLDVEEQVRQESAKLAHRIDDTHRQS